MSHSMKSTTDKVLSSLASDLRAEMGIPDTVPAPTLEDIQAMAIATPEQMKGVSVESDGKRYRVRIERELGEKEMDATRRVFPLSTVIVETVTRAIENSNISVAETFRHGFVAEGKDLTTCWGIIARHITRTAGEPSAEQVKWLHTHWTELDADDRPDHPLYAVVEAWLQEQTTKHVSREYDRKHPAAVIKHQMGSIRDINFVDIGDATLRKFASPERGEQIQTPQLLFDFAEDAPSILPAVMPLHVAHPMGVKATTRKGAVSHVVRIFFEALMALEPSKHQADIMFRLGDLIDYLYPDGIFNRTNQLPHIIKALDILHFHATVPFRDDQGDLRAWRPVTVKSPIDINAKNDTPVFMRVDLPPDAQQGYIILKKIHRHLGKVSGPKFNAYHAAAWLWDRHGTVKGKLIDPTRPIEKRNDTGLVDSTGKPIVTAKGKPITNLYHHRAVTQLERERNPAADRYPVLSETDLILACNPNGHNPKTRKRDLKRAKEHWTEMEKSGIICIERLPQGWRIMPGTAHMKGYRGAKDAQKKRR